MGWFGFGGRKSGGEVATAAVPIPAPDGEKSPGMLMPFGAKAFEFSTAHLIIALSTRTAAKQLYEASYKYEVWIYDTQSVTWHMA